MSSNSNNFVASKGRLTLTSTPPINFSVVTVTDITFSKVVDKPQDETYVSGEDITFILTITNASNKINIAIIIAEINSAITPSGYQINNETVESIDSTKLTNNTVEIKFVDIAATTDTTIKIFGKVN